MKVADDHIDTGNENQSFRGISPRIDAAAREIAYKLTGCSNRTETGDNDISSHRQAPEVSPSLGVVL